MLAHASRQSLPWLIFDVGQNRTMACRGMFFAVTKEEEAKLLSASDSDAVVDIVTEEIEERWDEAWLQQMDKSWDAIHRCLGDGSLRNSQPAVSAKAVLGGRQLSSRDDWVVSYLTKDEVKQVAEALAPITEEEFRRRYFGLKKKFLWFDRTEYEGRIGEEDFGYSWAYFDDMRRFFRKAASADRATVFAVDQ
jgi:hypothetical protein